MHRLGRHFCFGVLMVLACFAARAQAPLNKTKDRYTAHLQDTLRADRIVKGSRVVWRCQANTCVGEDQLPVRASEDVALEACRALVEQIGIVVDFQDNGRKFGKDQLAKCNLKGFKSGTPIQIHTPAPTSQGEPLGKPGMPIQGTVKQPSENLPAITKPTVDPKDQHAPAKIPGAITPVGGQAGPGSPPNSVGQIRIAPSQRVTPLPEGSIKPLLPASMRYHWVLSGGGAKGSFQVGALKFMAERLESYRPESISGTSVGSINALSMAEGTRDGYRKMERVWLRLRHPYHMFLPSSWVLRLPARLQASRNGLVCTSFPGGSCSPWRTDSTPIATPQVFSTLEDIGLFLGAVGVPIVDFAILSGVRDDIDQAADLMSHAEYLYSLDPTLQRMADNIDPEAILRSHIKLRLVSVGLENSQVQYVTEGGNLIVGRGSAIPAALRGDLRQALLNGAMASAGIPGLFPSVILERRDGGGYSTSVDGGIRAVLPIRAALDIISTLPSHDKGDAIIAVSAGSANEVDPRPLVGAPATSDFRRAQFADRITKSIDILVNEVHLKEFEPIGGWKPPVTRFHIRPKFNVHGTQEVDPGLILISMAYGYMSAFDEFYKWGKSIGAYEGLDTSTAYITQARKLVWQKETELARKLYDMYAPTRPPTLAFSCSPPVAEELRLPEGYRGNVRFLRSRDESRTLIREIRELKRDVYNQVTRRIERFGRASIPEEFSDPERGYTNTASDWWTGWERHSFIDGGDLRDAPAWMCTRPGFMKEWSLYTNIGDRLRRTTVWGVHHIVAGDTASEVLEPSSSPPPPLPAR